MPNSKFNFATVNFVTLFAACPWLIVNVMCLTYRKQSSYLFDQHPQVWFWLSVFLSRDCHDYRLHSGLRTEEMLFLKRQGCKSIVLVQYKNSRLQKPYAKDESIGVESGESHFYPGRRCRQKLCRRTCFVQQDSKPRRNTQARRRIFKLLTCISTDHRIKK